MLLQVAAAASTAVALTSLVALSPVVTLIFFFVGVAVFGLFAYAVDKWP